MYINHRPATRLHLLERIREIEVGRIKRSADPAPNHHSAPSKDRCRIGVAALLDSAYYTIASRLSPLAARPSPLAAHLYLSR